MDFDKVAVASKGKVVEAGKLGALLGRKESVFRELLGHNSSFGLM